MTDLRRLRLASLALGPAVFLAACASDPATTTDAAADRNSTATSTRTAAPATSDALVLNTTDDDARSLTRYDIGFERTPSVLATYERHITTLADPVVMAGRLPGTEGIANAAQYIEREFERLGLEPAFPVISGDGDSVVVGSRASFRQPFEVGGGAKLRQEDLSVRSPSGAVSVFEPGEQYNVLGYGGSGYADAPLAFIGYSIDGGPDGYTSFTTADGTPLDDLTGHVAMLFRFEPHNEDGTSAFAEVGWSGAAGLSPKFTAAVQRGAEAIIMVTPPGVDDPRADRLESIETTGWGASVVDVPVVHMTPQAADLLLEAARAGVTLDELIADANDLEAGSARVFSRAAVAIDAEIDRSPISTDNIGAILPGSGELAGEYVVMGAHYDHVGNGPYGTRRPGELHPGADDNASGTSGVLLAASLLSDMYAALGDDFPRRSVLFLLFSAEESGLNGSRYYVDNAIAPASAHQVMINLDMIGSYGDGQGLAIGSLDSGDRLRTVFGPALEATDLEITEDTGVGSGRSDHASFDRGGIPNIFLFSGITDEYHTPDDTLDTIDIEGAATIATLAANLALSAALDEGDVTHVERREERTAIGGPLNIRVRVGIAPGSYGGNDGIVVGQVYEDTSAALGGLKEGDKIISWNGEKVTTVQSWMPMLANHAPGDEVDVIVIRDGEEMTLTLELQARRQDG